MAKQRKIPHMVITLQKELNSLRMFGGYHCTWVDGGVASRSSLITLIRSVYLQ